MFRFIKNKKLIKIISFLLIFTFSLNLVGCEDADNGVMGDLNGGGIKHYAVGVGGNVNGYTVYSQSTLDPMTKELFMGYLVNARDFTLLVLPGEEGDEEGTYILRDYHNILYTSAQSGIYQYDPLTGEPATNDSKALVYYVTDLELLSWFNEFETDGGFFENVLEFTSGDVDIEKPKRFKCSIMVNLGMGLNANDFCGVYSDADDSLINGIIAGDTPIRYESGIISRPFENAETGGMFIFFGYTSIEGYMTYQHITEYNNSHIIESMESNCYYSPGSVGKFDFDKLAAETKQVLLLEGYTENEINAHNTDDIKSDIISIYTERKMIGKTGCERLKETYKLLEASLLTDENVDTIGALKTKINNKLAGSLSAEDRDKYTALKGIISDVLENFEKNRYEEVFNVKLSYSLFSRYGNVKNISRLDGLTSGQRVNKITEVGSAETAITLSTNSNDSKEDYVLLVTADGFIHDRGSEQDQVIMGAGELTGYSAIMQELIRLDACPNGTVAAEMFNMLANLKIVAGTALAVAGVTAIAVAGVGLAVASVIAKLAAVSLATPVPGGRIVALVLIGVAGLVALAAGAILLYQGIKDKARVKGFGASEENYCDTYKATINMLFDTMTLSVPVHHYRIPKANNGDGDDAIYQIYCEEGVYEESNSKCNVYEDGAREPTEQYEPVKIPLYYYADREQSEKMRLQGVPAMLYYSNGELVDCIYGAATPQFLVETLRVWGLLAMREIVYRATYTAATHMVAVYRTANTNARTMKVLQAKYCYTFEFEKDVYGSANNDNKGICYYSGSTNGVAKNINKTWNASMVKEPLLTIDISNTSSIETYLNEMFGDTQALIGYFDELAVYRYNQIKNDMFTSVVEEKTAQAITEFTFNSVEEIAQGAEISVTFKVDGSTQSLSGATYLSGSTVIMINNTGVYMFEQVSGSYVYYGLIATFRSGKSPTSLQEVLEKEGIGYFEFIEFISGNASFGDSNRVTIPLYMTVTVKESPQANYYYKDGKKVTCDSGEYVYWRDNLVFSDKYKCLADNKVKSKDSKASVDDVNNHVGKNTPDGDYAYYSTSVQVADMVVTIKNNGQATFTIEWSTTDKK